MTTPSIPKGERFFAHSDCFICGRANQSIFTIAEIYLHYTAANYTKSKQFFNVDFLPSAKEIRNHIWQVSDKNNTIIEHAKNRIKFRQYRAGGLMERLEWMKVYREVKQVLLLCSTD